MKRALLLKNFQHFGLALVLGFLMVPGAGFAEKAGDVRRISLNPSLQESIQPFQVRRDAEVKFSNGFEKALHHFTVIRIDSEKKILTIQILKPGQSLNLAFSREGSYGV
ncbi:MAG: hypothetical protein GWM98_10720, partial [Nitrospinaceae bacterium]|nr:hypothetical protein [Nitrospinaceae bacterium]NIR54876.1 hypothetical protein [Nitrospinaceae bacterium]NIS85301.1 hypothetical protein [Nitrospinaceae bacterium]NIT82114.1 hypothetical protein [Nitrospinaceae bacterium]NIU44375.1 hypothetical protein [Nitrospinaceae bacterium]